MTDEARAALEQRGRRLAGARAAAKTEMALAEAEAKAAAGAVPETEIATTLGVDRMTVRKWLGKR